MAILSTLFLNSGGKESNNTKISSKTLWQEIKSFKPKTTKQLRSEGAGVGEILAAWVFVVCGLFVVAGGVYLFLFSILNLVRWAFEALFLK